MDKLAKWMGASSGEELRTLHNNLKLYESSLYEALEAIEDHAASPYVPGDPSTIPDAFEHLRTRDEKLREIAAQIRSRIENPT